MKRTLLSSLATSIALSAALPAFAADVYPGTQLAAQPPAAQKTCDQVRAELAEARRTGEVYTAGDAALPLNAVYPKQYAPAARSTALRPTEAYVGRAIDPTLSVN